MATIHQRETGRTLRDPAEIGAFLTHNGIFYEHWDIDLIPPELRDHFALDEDQRALLLASMRPAIERLAKSRGYVKWDVISLSDATPDLEVLLRKFEQVHTHTEDEVRAIVAGEGIFVIKAADGSGYFDAVLEPGDVISVPENTPHFFTLTESRRVVAVRLFIDPAGWVAHPFVDQDAAAGKR